MRRPGGGHYGGAADSGGGNYGGADSSAAATYNSGHQTMLQQQWRWELESPKLATNSMSPNMFPEGQGSEASRPYYQGQRTDPRLALENQGGKDTRARPREEDMDIGYEDKPVQQTLEGLEQKFLDDIMKLTKEQNDAEDAENSRHRERINAINTQYQEQLVALRARQANHRDEVLRRESHARKQQYEQVALDNYRQSSMNANNARGYVANSPAGERQQPIVLIVMTPIGETARYLGNSGRDHGYEPRVQYPGGRVYDTGSRYY
ncbi:unnamed protein product [Withania somnifera]